MTLSNIGNYWFLNHISIKRIFSEWSHRVYGHVKCLNSSVILLWNVLFSSDNLRTIPFYTKYRKNIRKFMHFKWDLEFRSPQGEMLLTFSSSFTILFSALHCYSPKTLFMHEWRCACKICSFYPLPATSLAFVLSFPFRSWLFSWYLEFILLAFPLA